MKRLLPFIFISLSGCAGANQDEAVTGAVGWYYRWLRTGSITASGVNCRIAMFSSSSFAYCKPGALAIDLETPKASPAVVTNITIVLTDFPKELRDYLGHRYSGPAQKPVTRTLSIPASALAACHVSLSETRKFYDTAVDIREKERLANKGISLRFPLACEGDPFYLVYFMKSGRVEWIWQISPGQGPVWDFVGGSIQRRIPDLAERKLRNAALWYEPPSGNR